MLDQWRLELQQCLGLQSRQIGQLGGGRRRRSHIVDLVMIQSLRSEESRRLRSHEGKSVVTVYDYHDGLVPVLARMQVRRRRTLEGTGFRVDSPDDRHDDQHRTGLFGGSDR